MLLTAAIGIVLFTPRARVARTRLLPGWLSGAVARCRAPGAWPIPFGRQRLRDSARDDAVLFGELVALGLGAGLPFMAAAVAAGDRVGHAIGGEVSLVARSARSAGSTVVLARAGGATGPLFRSVARANATGAPVGPVVASFVRDLRQARAAERAAATKKLPVRLLIPLTLLILPGFVVLTLGPALIGGLDRLQL